MEKSIRDHLNDTFEELGKSDQKKFKSKLCDRKQEPRIRKVAVERTEDALDLTDLMVRTFTSNGAVAVTIEILEAIQCNEESEELKLKTKFTGARGSSEVSQGSSSAPTIAEGVGSSGVSTGSSGAPSNGPQFIDKHRSELINRVDDVDAILDILLDKNIITQRAYDNIRCKNTPVDKMREIFSGPVKSAGDAGKVALYEALIKEQAMLMRSLGAQ